MNRLVLFLAMLLVSGVKNDGPDDDDDNKIIGGEFAKVGEFPFIVSIQFGDRHMCGGCLLSGSIVLTACHCVVDANEEDEYLKPSNPSKFNVVAGTVNLGNRGFSSYRRLKVNALKQHPLCENPKTGWTWDFGLIQLMGSFPMIPQRIEAIPLRRFSDTPKVIDQLSDLGAKCVGAGWGVTSESGRNGTPDLLRVDLTLWPSKNCAVALDMHALEMGSALRFNPTTQICALGSKNEDACKGDSGGPLLCNTALNGSSSGKLELIAIVSWGIGCGRRDVPGGWARLDIAFDWIKETSNIFATTAYSHENGKSVNSVLVLLTVVLKLILN